MQNSTLSITNVADA